MAERSDTDPLLHRFRARAEELAGTGADGVSELVNHVLQTAVDAGASDVLLEPERERTRLRIRLDGVMRDLGELPKSLAPNLVARCKVMAGLLSYRQDLPQEGGADGSIYGAGISLRISTYPALYGERVAVRIVNPSGQQMTLTDLGMAETIRRDLEGALLAPDGLILLSGPSGSGKTTTLHAAIRHILKESRRERSVVTVEDPVEREVEGATQTRVNPAAGLTFAVALRSLLRQDPEVLMVGEIRDVETAGIAVEASLTGHLVLSTVHAPRAHVVPHRLLDMQVEPYALAGAVSLVIAQRLVRRLCADCRARPPAEALRHLPESMRDGIYVPVGCDACLQTGYRGRMMLAERMNSSLELHDAIMRRDSRDGFARIARAQGEGLPEAIRQAVSEGLTSESELQRVLSSIHSV